MVLLFKKFSERFKSVLVARYAYNRENYIVFIYKVFRHVFPGKFVEKKNFPKWSEAFLRNFFSEDYFHKTRYNRCYNVITVYNRKIILLWNVTLL